MGFESSLLGTYRLSVGAKNVGALSAPVQVFIEKGKCSRGLADGGPSCPPERCINRLSVCLFGWLVVRCSEVIESHGLILVFFTATSE